MEALQGFWYHSQMQIHIAGGAVRDLLLGRRSRDKDYLVLDANKTDFLRAFPHAQEVGKSFPVFIDHGREFSFPRKNNLEDELLARDFTINAMALGPDGDLVCHPMALDDIKNRILRPASGDAITQDPLRIFRAARFWATLPQFSIHPTLLSGMQEASRRGLLRTIPADRIGAEIQKAMGTQKPGNFLRLLQTGDCLKPWFSELKDVIETTACIMDTLAGKPETVWAGLCHTLQAQNGLIAYRLGLRLRLPGRYVVAGEKGAALHLKALQYATLAPEAKVDLLMAAHTSGTFSCVFALADAFRNTNIMHQAKKDLATILQIKLPPEEQNLGPHSGQKLRDLRSKALLKSKRL
jgi:tRNA nucleotidyltransferase (CCA-adding enzyme)